MTISGSRPLRSWLATIIVLTGFDAVALAAGDLDFADVVDQIHRGHGAEGYVTCNGLPKPATRERSISWESP